MLHKLRYDILASVFFHIFIGAILVVGESCMSSSKPEPVKVTIVRAISAPAKQKKTLPNRAARAPKASKGKQKKAVKTAPKKENKPVPKPTPVKNKLPTPQKEKPKPVTQKKKEPEQPKTSDKSKGNPENKRMSREELLKRMNEEKSDPTAPLGPKDRQKTSKDGKDKNMTPIGRGRVNPILGKYIEDARERIIKNWHILPGLAEQNPDLEVHFIVKVYPSGKLGIPKLHGRSSGNKTFDRSAKMAIQKTRELGPPPEKYRDSAEQAGVIITLTARDKI